MAALSAVCVVLATGLDSSAAPGTLFDRDSATSKATDRLHRQFGDEPVLVLIRTRKAGCPGGRNCRLTDLLLTPDLVRLLSFEGCVSGNIPRRAKSPAPVCGKFAGSKPFQVVNGPGTFINESARQISSRIKSQQRQSALEVKQASEAARRVAAARGLSQVEQSRLAKQARQLAQLNALQPALRYGLNPRGAGIGDPSFVHQLVFEPSISFDAPKTRFAQFFPSRASAVVELRPRPNLTESQRREAIDLVREAVATPSFRLESARYVVTGEPVAALGVASDLSDALLVLLIASLVIVTATLALVFRSGKRLLPLVPAVATVAITFGLMSLLGATLTIASIAILPVLAGIAVALGVHFQRTGSLPLAAAGATAIGFGVLVASPVPMVRTFGAFVALGIVLSLVLTATLGSALLRGDVRGLSLLRRAWHALANAAPARPPRAFAHLARIVRNALARLRNGWASLIRAVVRRPRAVLGIAVAAALVGWVLAPQSEVASGLGRLAPDDVREVKDLDALGREGGMERGVSVLVTAKDLTAPGVIGWMVAYQRKVLSRHGYTEKRPCPEAELCPMVALADLFGSGRARSRTQTRRLLDRLPSYFTQGVISRDRQTANVSFLIRRMPIDEQKNVIDDMRRQLDPPASVEAELAGRTALAVDAADFGSNGRKLALLALAALFLMLAVWRLGSLGASGASSGRIATAAVSVLPAVMAGGWSALIVLVSGTSLNPMSATLGALVIGLGGYVTIVLSGLYREGRATGISSEAAFTRAYALGAVMIASGATAIAGFGALIVSDVRMLREFGSIAIVALAVVLTGVALVLPAVLIWAEQRKPVKLPRSRAEWGAAGLGAYRKVRAGIGALGRSLRRLPAAVRALPRQVRRLGGLVGRARRSRPLRRRGEARGQ